MNLSVVKSMQVIRDAAKVAQRAEVAPLVAAAVEVANAFEELVSHQPVVSIGSGPLIDADAIAAKVVERFDIIAVERVKVAAPLGMSQLPWRYNDMGCIFSGPEDENEVEVADLWVSRDGIHADGRAIVEAVNAYFGGVSQPPTPAEAATANCETQLPDTAGYPVPDYDAVEIPPSAA